MNEILRILTAMQTSDEHGIATPANWHPGDEVIIPPPDTDEVAGERVAGAGEDYECLDWFLCLKKLD
jgi:peroxiredoxin (alkyl hydroperoxide reductase subunit C)